MVEHTMKAGALPPPLLRSSCSSEFVALNGIAEEEEDHHQHHHHCFIPLPSSSPPQTPHQSLEFLSRSWSVSAAEVAKAFVKNRDSAAAAAASSQPHHQVRLVTAPFSFARPDAASNAPSIATRDIVHRILSPQTDGTSFPSSRTSHGSCFASATNNNDNNNLLPSERPSELVFGRSLNGVNTPFTRKSMGKWLKDSKEKKKEVTRIHNAEVHAAVSVAGVAAAVAAIAAATAATSTCHMKTSMAMASASALVAAQCVEIAENMGADHEQLSSVVSSAVNVKSAGDVMTLTAAAATALRGAATLKARTSKEDKLYSEVKPCKKGMVACYGEIKCEGSEADACSLELMRRGHKFLKRSRKGKLLWRIVVVYVNKHSQVILKSKGEYLGGAIIKEKKRIVEELYTDMPPWPGRTLLDVGNHTRYFGIKTDHGVMELECRNETDYRLWTGGILRLLGHQTCRILH